MYRRINTCSTVLVALIGMLFSSCEQTSLLSASCEAGSQLGVGCPNLRLYATVQQLEDSNLFATSLHLPHALRLRGGRQEGGPEGGMEGRREEWKHGGENTDGNMAEETEATAEDVAEMQSVIDTLRQKELERAGLAFE
eukprot:1109987-Rhodomonas_salina.2